MKNYILILSVLFSVIAYSQAAVLYDDDLEEEILTKFKSSITYFVFNDGAGMYSKEDYQKILEDIWDITPFEIIKSSELKSTLKLGGNIIYFQSYKDNPKNREKPIPTFNSTGLTAGGIFYIAHIDYGIRLGVINFSTDIITKHREKKIKKDTLFGNLSNYRLGYLKNNFQLINNGIKNNKPFLYDDYVNKGEIGVLKNETLYIADNVIFSYNAFTFKKKEKSLTADELFKEYNYEAKIIPVEDLNKRILDKNQDKIYYLLYNQSASSKRLAIINSKTGEVLYQFFKSSFNLKPKDFKRINKAIETGKI